MPKLYELDMHYLLSAGAAHVPPKQEVINSVRDAGNEKFHINQDEATKAIQVFCEHRPRDVDGRMIRWKEVKVGGEG